MRRNSHVRFLGGWVAATPPTYPPILHARAGVPKCQKCQKAGRKPDARGFWHFCHCALQRDAILFSVGSNASHGERLTNADRASFAAHI